MLTKEEYIEALKALMQGAMGITKFNPVEAMKIMTSLPNFIWDLTRPDAYVRTTDLTPRLCEQDGLTDKVSELKVVVVFDGDDNPVVGYGQGRSITGDEVFSPTEIKSRHHAKFMDEIIQEALTEMGVDQSTEGIMSLDKLMKSSTEKNIEDEVAAFSSELDSLFDTWNGGGR